MSIYIVVNTHLDMGIDFFTCSVPKQVITLFQIHHIAVRVKFLNALEIGKPFAMLVGVVGLFESQERFNMFADNDFEIMYMNKRISYFKNYAEQKPSLNPPFSKYICVPKTYCLKKIYLKQLRR